MNAAGGYTRQYRRLWGHHVFRNKQEAAVFAWMKDEAAWQRTTVRTAHGMVELEVGELLTTDRQIADDFGLDRKAVRRLMERMVEDGMVTVSAANQGKSGGTKVKIVNYLEYQGIVVDLDETREARRGQRKAQSGAKEGAKEGAKDDTDILQQYQAGASPRQEASGPKDGPKPGPKPDADRGQSGGQTIDNEVKEKEERESPPVDPPQAQPEVPALPALSRRTRKALALVPEDWEPTEEGVAYAADKACWWGGQLDDEVEGFRDYSKAHSKGYADFNAAWRTWVRNGVKFGERRANGRRGAHQAETDAFYAAGIELKPTIN